MCCPILINKIEEGEEKWYCKTWPHFSFDNVEFNVVKAGRAIPVKFSLDGDQGLKIFEVDYPKSTPIVCPTDGSVTPDEIMTVTAGGSSLSYADGQYTYVWKTDKLEMVN